MQAEANLPLLMNCVRCNMTQTDLAIVKLLDEIQSLLYYESNSWPLRCSLSSSSVHRIDEIAKEIKQKFLIGKEVF